MNIAVYSGSFNPIHSGHIELCRYLAKKRSGEIDEIWLLVTPRNPLKPDAEMASNENRIEMCMMAVGDMPNVKVSDFEMSLKPPFFSSETLDALSIKYPRHNFRLVIGADNWLCFDRWHAPEKIISEHGLIIYPRPGFDMGSSDKLPENVRYLSDAPLFDISSTEIRNRVAGGKSIENLTASEVAEYIKDKNLYK